MTSNIEFYSLVERLLAGEDAAIERIHLRFARRLIALASRQHELWALKSTDSDPEDVVQSVFRTFFARSRRGEFQFEGWGAVWAVLALITRRKCLARRDYLRAARRSREVGGTPDAAAARDRGPTPLEAAVLSETLAMWLGGLGPPERSIVELGLEGRETRWIALRLGRSERSVRRVRRQAELDLRSMLDVAWEDRR